MYRPSPHIARLALAVVACSWLQFASPAWSQDDDHPTPKFTITFDGKPISPRVQYVGGTGDRARYLLHMDVVLTLGPERELNFTHHGESKEKLFLTPAGQQPRLVGVQVQTTYRDDKAVLVNPLETLSDAELRGLWGVKINHWSDEIAQKLTLIDPVHTCVTLREEVAQGKKHALPPLPAGIVALRIESNSSEGLKKLDELANQTQLKSLSVNLTGAASFDCALVKQATQLEFLELTGNTLRNTDALGSLTELQVLNADYCKGLTKVSFAAAMTKLTTLRISNTPVADLSPLEGLPELQTVDANRTAVRKLPALMPALVKLDVVSSRMTDADVRAFQQANAKCQVRHRWGASMQVALKPATRLRIRSGGTCHRELEAEKTLFETKAANEIQQLLAGIQINEEKSGFHCMCCGNPSLEFYDGDQLIATLGFHHGMGLRWPGGWPGDAALTPQSVDFLIEWLANRNVTGPRKEREAAADEAKAGERKIVQATIGMSPSLAKAFRLGAPQFATALKKELPDKLAQVEVLLRVFGTSNDSWSTLDPIEQLAEDQLKGHDTKTLAAAVEKGLTGKDRQLRRGAARFWESWHSPVEEWNPPNIAELHRIVLQIQQEAHYYPSRMSALDGLARWKNELSDDDFAQRLSAGLHDPAPQVRRKAMLIAGRTKHKQSALTLMSVLQNETLKLQPLPDVPLAESQDVPDGFDTFAKGCSDVEVAALALGYMQHAPAKSLIEAIQPPTAMLDVALALFGDGVRLKAEHFASKSRNQELQLAAVQVVIDSKGKYGLQLALGYQQATHWWEGEHVAGRLSQMLQKEKAPGSEELSDCKDLKTLQRWYQDHGAEYLKRFEAK